MNEDIKQLNSDSEYSFFIIGCQDCPFSYEFDMAEGYGCKIDAEKRDIRQSKKFQPITPDWCPIKNGKASVKYRRQLFTIEFIKWYSGMDEKKIMKAYERWRDEKAFDDN